VTTVAGWLAMRQPAPPSALEGRLRAALGEDARRDARDAADVCLAAGERLLATVLRDDEANRECALDLLAADALVTYAFEAASESPADLAARAAHAMSAIASLGAPAARS
jgi:hypothetical protein